MRKVNNKLEKYKMNQPKQCPGRPVDPVVVQQQYVLKSHIFLNTQLSLLRLWGLKAKLKFIDAGARSRAELDRITTLKKLEMAQATLVQLKMESVDPLMICK